VRRFPDRRKERYLSVAELERLGAALRRGETVGFPRSARDDKRAPKAEVNDRISMYAAAAIRLLLFTGARRGEILQLRWDQVDLDRRILALPTSKTGHKVILLNGPAAAVLLELPRTFGNPFVIAGTKTSAPLADLKRVWSAICREANLPSLRIHDLRHSFASVGAGANLGLPIIGKLLGHTQASTTQRYAHLADDPLRRAAEIIGGAIAAGLRGA
jgi:integrase